MPVAGCGRQADMVLPDQVENPLHIVWVDAEDVGCPATGCLRQRGGVTELWPGVLVQPSDFSFEQFSFA